MILKANRYDIFAGEDLIHAMRSSDRQNAKITLDEKVEDKFQELIWSHTNLYKQFTDDPEFRAFVQAMVFEQVYEPDQESPSFN